MNAPPPSTTTSKDKPDEVSKDYVDVLLYCRKPSKYASLPKLTREHYDALCQLIEASKPERKSDWMLFLAGVGKTFETLGTFVTHLPYMLTVGIFTDPSQLSMVLLTDPKFGLPRGREALARFSKQLFNGTVDDMNRWGFKFIQKMQIPPTAVPVVKPSVIVPNFEIKKWFNQRIGQFGRKATFLLNRLVFVQCVRNAFHRVVSRTAGRAVGFASVRAFLVVARMIGAAATAAIGKILSLLVRLNPILLIVMVISIIGMIVDSIDPCNLNKTMDAETIRQFSMQMDDQFRDMMILQHNVIFTGMSMSQTGEEEMQFVNQWPIDVKVETLFPYYPFNKANQDKDIKNARLVEFGLTDEDQDDVQEMSIMYQQFYLENLKFNAYGQPLLFPENYDPPNIEPETLQLMQQQVNFFFANNNPVVSRWMVKYSPLILVAIVGLLFIIFKFIG